MATPLRKAHGAGNPELVGPEPEAAPLVEMGLGWKNAHGSGKGDDTTTSGVEGPGSPNPTTWDNGYFDMLFGYEWELGESPAGAKQWHPVDVKEEHLIPSAHGTLPAAKPMMTTADMSLRMHPELEPIARRFWKNPDEFADAFARAWFKLTHRDMGPKSRYLGPEVPAEEFPWQDPVPATSATVPRPADLASLKEKILGLGLSLSDFANRCLVIRRKFPWLRQARWCQWRSHRPRAAAQLGMQ